MSDEQTVDAAAEIEAEANDEMMKTFEFNGETYRMKRKFRRLRFLRLITRDPVAALELAIPEDELERLEDQEITGDELEALLEAVAKELAGSQGNSGPSQR